MEQEVTNNTNASTDSGIQIQNVNQSIWEYLKQKKSREIFVLAPLIVVWEVLLLYISLRYFHSMSGFIYLMILPLMLVYVWIYKLKKEFEEAFLQEFASANNFSFDKAGSVDETYGTIFRIDGNQSVSDVVSGMYSNSSFKLFLYELTVGSGRNQQVYKDTVIELDLHGQLPNLLMINKKSHYGGLNIANSFGIRNKFSLEGDFNQFFTLYGQPNNQIEALEVFSPDTMALMEFESKHYNVEFSGNRIYIYVNGFIHDISTLNQVFTLAKKLTDKIAPLAGRLQNDSAIIATPVNIDQTRKSIVIKLNKLAIIIILAVFFIPPIFISLMMMLASVK
jgi:hypothetical protein